MQIQQTAVQSQRALSVTRAQTTAKERERRILQLTIDEIRSIEGDVPMYKGVGKMYYFESMFSSPRNSILSRFMAVPRATMEKDLQNQEKGLSDELSALSKKVY